MENDVGIIILAGGKSNRMGTDKGLLVVNNLPVIQYIINTCQKISNDIIIVSNNEDYKQFGYPVIEDKIKNIGPMGGLYAGLLSAKIETNLILSCDVPLVSKSLLMEIITAKSDKNDVIVSKYKKQIHPLIGLYSKLVIPKIEYFIKGNLYKMSKIYSKDRSMVLDLSHFPSKEFLNLNTIKELELFKQILNDS